MSARTKARKRALDVLFESEVRGLELDGTLAERLAAQEPPVKEYTVELVRGVTEHRARMDEHAPAQHPGVTVEMTLMQSRTQHGNA